MAITAGELREKYCSIDACIQYIESQMRLAAISEKEYIWDVPWFLRHGTVENKSAIMAIENHFKAYGFGVRIQDCDWEICFSWYG